MATHSCVRSGFLSSSMSIAAIALLAAPASRAQTTDVSLVAAAPESVAAADTTDSSSDTSASGRKDPYALKEVTVTAEKRSVNLQNVPLAVTAISGDTLDKSNVTDLTGLNGYVPGLAVEKSSGSELMISIRGVGSETPQ